MLDHSKGGQYTGYDTWKEGIDWATNNISSDCPNAHFKVLGSANENVYDAATAYDLDLELGSHDACVATSLFTHLRKPAAEHYFSEISRILRPGGRACITYLADKQSFHRLWNGPGWEEDEYAIHLVKEMNEDTFVAEPQIVAMAERHGMRVFEKHYGFWRGEKYFFPGAEYQDVFLFERL